MTKLAHEAGAKVCIDGAQAVAHSPVDVREIGCDFYAFSGHKMYAPMGIGVLWAKRELLDAMPPWQGGGEMILSVSFEKTTYNVAPHKFEAGTPDVGGAVGLAAAVDYIDAIGRDRIAAQEHQLMGYAAQALATVPGLRFIGTARAKAAVHSFVLDGIHPHDVGTVLDHEGVAVRTGHHCAQPVMERFQTPATVRASFGVYNTTADVDRLVAGLARVKELLG
jgi:cysteine desulfurase/selenocysteine lyase